MTRGSTTSRAPSSRTISRVAGWMPSRPMRNAAAFARSILSAIGASPLPPAGEAGGTESIAGAAA